jgi:glycosyltransferase involved in cell wall biosynthesis
VPRLLMITKFLPDGRTWGGMLRTLHLTEALRKRFDVRMVGYVENGTPGPRSKIAAAAVALPTGKAYQVARYDTPIMRRMIREAIDEFQPDALHVEYLQMVTTCWDVDLPAVLDLQNVESAFAGSIAEASRGAARYLGKRDARLLRDLEVRCAERFAFITVPSAKEVERMPGNSYVVGNGVDPSVGPLDVTPDPNRIVFVGTMSWLPNIEGAEWFVREVFPLLPDDVELDIVGRTPHRRVLALASDRIRVSADVPDTMPYVAGAAVVVAPLLSPGGTRLKILEGLLAERPVVATPEAADGLEDLQGHGLVLESDPKAFAASIMSIAADPDRAAEMGRAGRLAVVERYSWDEAGARMLDLYETHLGLS